MERIDRIRARDGAEKILKEENEEERQKSPERMDRFERGILFRRNQNNNVCFRILLGRRLGPWWMPSWVEGREYYYVPFILSCINKK